MILQAENYRIEYHKKANSEFWDLAIKAKEMGIPYSRAYRNKQLNRPLDFITKVSIATKMYNIHLTYCKKRWLKPLSRSAIKRRIDLQRPPEKVVEQTNLYHNRDLWKRKKKKSV